MRACWAARIPTIMSALVELHEILARSLGSIFYDRYFLGQNFVKARERRPLEPGHHLS
jgi:hypothetical protein